MRVSPVIRRLVIMVAVARYSKIETAGECRLPRGIEWSDEGASCATVGDDGRGENRRGGRGLEGPLRFLWKGQRHPNPRLAGRGPERGPNSRDGGNKRDGKREGDPREKEREKERAHARPEAGKETRKPRWIALEKRALLCVSVRDSYGPQATLSQYRATARALVRHAGPAVAT